MVIEWAWNSVLMHEHEHWTQHVMDWHKRTSPLSTLGLIGRPQIGGVVIIINHIGIHIQSHCNKMILLTLKVFRVCVACGYNTAHIVTVKHLHRRRQVNTHSHQTHTQCCIPPPIQPFRQFRKRLLHANFLFTKLIKCKRTPFHLHVTGKI